MELNNGLWVPEKSGIAAHGHFKFVTQDARTGQIHEELEADNLITGAGLTQLAGALIYNMVVNQNSGWGLPVPTSYANLGNLWGALGTGLTAPTTNDVALANEIGRSLVVNAAVISTGVAEVDFFFGTSQANGSIAEFGVFMNSYFNTTTLSAGLTNGTTYAALTVSPFLITVNGGSIPAGTILEINYGATSPTQYCKTSATVASGATSVPITNTAGGSFVAASNFNVGAVVALGPNGSGVTQPTALAYTMFDHALAAATVIKNSSETATLGLQITFTSM